jgi:hypothetical protein
MFALADFANNPSQIKYNNITGIICDYELCTLYIVNIKMLRVLKSGLYQYWDTGVELDTSLFHSSQHWTYT